MRNKLLGEEEEEQKTGESSEESSGEEFIPPSESEGSDNDLSKDDSKCYFLCFYTTWTLS